MIAPSTPLCRWQVSDVLATRYDLPDQPMAGEMDAAFFLTRDSNFIPHEYPCRTAFAADHRDRRPEVRGEPHFSRNWLPFGAPRVDLSGFWFRPTRIAAWARSRIEVAAAGAARFRLATCGGALLRVAGAEAGFLAPYTRNKEAEAILAADLPAGEVTLEVFFDDLAERDTRFYFQLDWLDGPPASEQAPSPAAAEIEAALETMHFDRPAYTGGEVALVLPRPLTRPARIDVAIHGEGPLARTTSLQRSLAPGQTRLILADAADLPADFRAFHIEAEADGFAAARSLGVEIARAASAAPATLDARIAETLATVAARGEPDPVTALARLATGAADPATEAMLDAALGPIADCWDCADFLLVPLLWARIRYTAALSPALAARIDDAVLGYRYWLDEPGNDVQWYFSENHALLFHTAAYLAGALLPGARFRRSGRTGAAQSATGRDRVRGWLDHFERWEMAEFNSAPYFPIDLKGLTALFALAPDPDIRARAGRGIARLLEIVANSAHHGLLTAAQGRSYEHSLRAGLSSELSAIARLLWGRGGFGAGFHALPQLALCLRDHGLTLPDLAARANWHGPGSQEWCFRQGQDGFAAVTHTKTRAWALGTAARYRWGEWGYQETLLHARIGASPQAQIWISHPGETIQGGFARPSFWGGSASIPRVHQYRGLALVAFDGLPPQPGFTHAWFPRAAFDATAHPPTAAFARCGEGLAALLADGTLTEIATGPSANCELRLPGRHGRWLLRLGETGQHGDLAAFRARFAGLCQNALPDGRIVVDDPDYGMIEFSPDGSVTAEGRRLDPNDWTLAGTRQEFPPPN